MNSVRYADSGELVLLGDIVTTRVFFFFKRKARVVYVPGISKRRSSLEYNGLTWVGLQELTGPFLSALVDPKDSRLDKSVKLIERGEPVVLPEDSDPFIEPGEVLDDEQDERRK
jgi:hypothetical protein